ncbi:MAG: hypothetical protein CMP38_07330 [Rickettsiales bacterium]|nr:hypothetical protein [Rickettsiales bacterium]OUV98861.1 MAG: hypothetical protein CBD16_09335 [Betaproteobacteria bacterium TMED156]|tara:strand:+ start:441 stop:815 length:375 start_codon:yes stop_codon:yes gene_type:complete
MKTILFSILILFSINAFAINWKKVAENKVGNYYVDFDSINNHDGLVYYSDLVNFIEPFKGDFSAISKYKVDCVKEKQTWLAVTTYSEPMGKGIINSKSFPNEAIYPKSNTIYFFLIKNLCNYKK